MALRKVFLYGDLAEKYGHEFEFDVNSFVDCFRALNCAFSDFFKTVIPNEYALLRGNDTHKAEGVQEDFVAMNLGSGAFHIVPRTFGASASSRMFNSGAVMFVVGAILVATGVGAPIGIGLMVGGAMTMLMSALLPDIPETEKDRSSFIFGGTANSVKQGEPVPLCYGEYICGSVVVSSSLSVMDMSDGYSVSHSN